jgi:NAD(P)-dependent dehydrogenase (short-subunit alcohol dehydrogenase family)
MAENRKSIFITGAASGLGREVARFFAKQGWFVGLADVNDAGTAETATMLPAGQSSTHHLDVTDRKQWTAALADFVKHTAGTVDVLFNNAGVGSGGPIQEMTDADIDRQIAINFTGVVSGIRAVFPYLRRGSCVLNTSSAAGIYGVGNLSVYSATKFAVRGLTESHDIEWRELGIKSRSLMPGFIDTNIIGAVAEGTNMTAASRRDRSESGRDYRPRSLGRRPWQQGAYHGEQDGKATRLRRALVPRTVAQPLSRVDGGAGRGCWQLESFCL